MPIYQLVVWIGSTQENVRLDERGHPPKPGETVEAEGQRWRVLRVHTNDDGELVPDLFDAELVD
jgi:hypothetical protein